MAKSRFRQEPDPVPIRPGSAVKVKEPDPVPIRSGSFRIRGIKTGTGLPGSGSVPIRFGPNIRSDRFQRTGALFFTVGFPIVVIQPKSSMVFIGMFRRLKWDKRGTNLSENAEKRSYDRCYLLLGCYCDENPAKRNIYVGTGSEPVPRNRIANR